MRSGVYAGRAESAYDELLSIHQAGIAITISTSLRQYDNMELESLEVPRSSAIGDVVHFTADFKQITTVESQTVTIPKKASKPPQQHLGTQPKKTETNPGPVKSIVKQGKVAISGINS